MNQMLNKMQNYLSNNNNSQSSSRMMTVMEKGSSTSPFKDVTNRYGVVVDRSKPSRMNHNRHSLGNEQVCENAAAGVQGQQQIVDEEIMVAVRVRPISTLEKGDSVVVEPSDVHNTVRIERLARNGGVLKSEQGCLHEYVFDKVFSEECGQQEVYEETAKKIVRHMLDGKSGCVFSYGQTGSGKTHTMMGSTKIPEQRGIVPRALEDLFTYIANFKRSERHSTIKSEFVCKVSFMEIYNEQIFDLLSEHQKSLTPCEDPSDGRVHVLGMTQEPVESVEQILHLLEIGTSRRRTNPTAANQVSSRSHAVLQVDLERSKTIPISSEELMSEAASLAAQAKSRQLHTRNSSRAVGLKVSHAPQPKKEIIRSRLSLIDLAGSERAAATQNRGLRLREGANINQSLLALANCINALSAGDKRVKYRDSKLTHVLKSSLVGNCVIVMIANISPSHRNYEESHNTLKIAARAKNIKSSLNISSSNTCTSSNVNLDLSSVSLPIEQQHENDEELSMADDRETLVEQSQPQRIVKNPRLETQQISSSTSSATKRAKPTPQKEVINRTNAIASLSASKPRPISTPNYQSTPPSLPQQPAPPLPRPQSYALPGSGTKKPLGLSHVLQDVKSPAYRDGSMLSAAVSRSIITEQERIISDMKQAMETREKDIAFLLQRLSELESEVVQVKSRSIIQQAANHSESSALEASLPQSSSTINSNVDEAIKKQRRNRRLSTKLVDLEMAMPSKMPKASTRIKSDQ